VASECKVAFDSYNILLVLVVLISQSFENSDFNLALLMKFLPVFEYFNGNCLLILMIKAFQNYTKGTSAEFLLNLIPILYLVLGLIQIVGLVVIKAKVKYSIWIGFFRILILASELSTVISANTF